MLVKICGITSLEVANLAIDAGADFIGFVFAESKRKISMEYAEEISREIPKHVKKVGVFVNESLDVVRKISTVVGLDYVQLHGDESPTYCDQISVPVIKAIQMKHKHDVTKLDQYNVDYFLLDSPPGKYRGGNGDTFDWSLVKHVSKGSDQIFLAGGLHSGNVYQAIKEVQPIGVDVSSGVESNGKKDPEKMLAFIREAKKKGD
ncbi:N-(5'-phosphoribosyl)anthranilate isomerase [Paraliobacillus sp. PM-2]|uniref:phosphoribosylanthranilate isomerase n=1 Tax=Paraliobacillus sp. PM-2 TaxID=1462524 RepID=UPI00061BC0CA|nr:phosphoribosylanthranilate isomerase [Paraliobacillus sp. PM-2]CQR46077.1 N-(5'-phosphoribosyl)anthranilate isomerase [Paraliobacillus sp. PM-2]